MRLKQTNKPRTIGLLGWIFTFTTIVVSLIPAIRCQAQGDNITYRVGQPDRSVFAPVPREVLLPLIRATRALDEGRTSEAVALLGQLLSEPMEENYLVPVDGVKGAEGVNVSLRARALEMLGALSTQDRSGYRLRYGTRARLMLEKAVNQHDFDAMSQVMQRFFFTEAGFSSAMLLGHHYLDEGHPVAAANCFRRVIECEEARQIHDPEASVLLATCRMLSDSTEQAKNVLSQLKSRFAKGQFQFEGRRIELFEDENESLAWLRQLIGNSSLRAIDRVNQWLMPGGNPQRNARSGNGIALINPNWEVPTVNDPDLERTIKARLNELINLGGCPIPSVQPLAIGDTIVMRSFDRMIGVNAKTGKRTWVFPPWNLSRLEELDFNDNLENHAIDEGNVTERMWLDSLYGQASSDGRNIFVVPNPGFAGENSLELNRGGMSFPIIKREFNELKAVEIGREGAFKWEVGGRTGLDEAKLAESFFLGAPLPHEGSLYAVCQQADQIKLVALDPESGKLRWSQQLVSVEGSVNVSKDRFRRLAGAAPSFSDGILVCATGAGALVGIDVSTKAIIWGYQFTTPGSRDVSQISPRQSSSQIVLEGLWRESTIMIAEGAVLHTPVDSQNLVCVDLETGFPKWKNDEEFVGQVPRIDSLYLACVESGNAIFIGPNSVRAIRLSDGTPNWEQNTEQFGRPSGRGYANNGCYFLPMTSERLLQIELQSGTIIKSVKTNGVLGNLICYQGDVISHGADQLASFPQDEPNRQMLESVAEQGPLTPPQLALKSQLQFQEGDLRAAAISMANAFDQTKNPAFTSGLAELIIQLVETDHDFGIELANRYDDSLFADREFEFAAARIEGQLAKGDFVLAFSELIQLIEPSREILQNEDKLIEVAAEKYDDFDSKDSRPDGEPPTSASHIKLRLDRWVRSRLLLACDRVDQQQREQFKVQVEQYIANGPAKDAVGRFEALQYFPNCMISGEQRIAIARDLLEDNELLRARFLLGVARQGKVENEAAQATAVLARMYSEINMDSRAATMTTELANRFSTTTIFDQQTGDEVARQIESEYKLNSRAFVAQNSNYSMGTASVVDSERQFVSSLSPNSVETKRFDYLDLQEYRFQFYGQTGEIEIFDGFGNSIFRFLARQKSELSKRPANNFVMGEARIAGDILLLSVATELFAIDWLKLRKGENPVLWNIDIENGDKEQKSTAPEKLWGENRMNSRRASRGRKKIFFGAPSGRGICYLDGTNLICLDTFTGKRCWQRTNIRPRSVLFGDAEKVTAWKGRDARIFDVSIGRQTKQLQLAPELGAIWTNQGNRLLLTQKTKLPGIPMDNKSEHPAPPIESNSEIPEQESFEEDPNLYRQSLGLYDLQAERFIWERQFPFSTKGYVIQNRKIAVLDPNGELEFVKIDSGESLFRSTTGLTQAQRARIEEIRVATTFGTHLIYLRKNTSSDRIDLSQRQVRIRNLHYYDSFWNGFLLAIDANTGQRKWKQPVRFENFQIAKSMPFYSPVRMFARRYDRNNAKYKSYMQLILLDIASGKTLTNVSLPFDHRNFYQVSWQANENHLQIDFPTKRLGIQLSNPSDMPPRPLASLTNESTIPLQPPTVREKETNSEQIASEMRQIQQEARLAENQLPQARAEELRQLQNENRDK